MLVEKLAEVAICGALTPLNVLLVDGGVFAVLVEFHFDVLGWGLRTELEISHPLELLDVLEGASFCLEGGDLEPCEAAAFDEGQIWLRGNRIIV